MNTSNKNKSNDVKVDFIEKAADAWVRLCLLQITNKNQQTVNHKDKNIYDNETK